MYFFIIIIRIINNKIYNTNNLKNNNNLSHNMDLNQRFNSYQIILFFFNKMIQLYKDIYYILCN